YIGSNLGGWVGCCCWLQAWHLPRSRSKVDFPTIDRTCSDTDDLYHHAFGACAFTSSCSSHGEHDPPSSAPDRQLPPPRNVIIRKSEAAEGRHKRGLTRRACSAKRRRNGVKEDGDEHAANSLYLPRRYLDTRRRKHCRARRRRRGLSGCARYLPRGV